MEMFPYTWDSVEPSGGGFQTIVYDAHPSHKKLNISYKDQNITLFLLLGKHGYASDFSNENLQISTFLNFLKEKQSDSILHTFYITDDHGVTVATFVWYPCTRWLLCASCSITAQALWCTRYNISMLSCSVVCKLLTFQ